MVILYYSATFTTPDYSDYLLTTFDYFATFLNLRSFAVIRIICVLPPIIRHFKFVNPRKFL